MAGVRKFGTDSPKFLAFTLGDSDEVYKLPLAASLPMDTLVEMREAADSSEAAAMRFQMELLHTYIGDAANGLTAGDVNDIFTAWNEDSAAAGATSGE